MESKFDIIISIATENNEICVEQRNRNGGISRKNISPESLLACVQNSCMEDRIIPSGLLPPHCIATSTGGHKQYYFLEYSTTAVDFTYLNTEYTQFPMPHLVFGFAYQPSIQKVTDQRVCVVAEGKLTSDMKLYHYPFSNVSISGHICIGNNALPKYSRPEQLSTLPDYILRMPNNNDYFQAEHNKSRLEYRDLLEYMKDKSPADYYQDILVESRKTLGQFLEWR